MADQGEKRTKRTADEEIQLSRQRADAAAGKGEAGEAGDPSKASQGSDNDQSESTADQKPSQDGSTDLKPGLASTNHADAAKPTPSIEVGMSGVDDDDDDDSEPIPLLTEEGSAELFPGVPCTTVAKRCKKGNSDPAPLYLNRYGPRAKGWFVWSTTPANLGGRSTDDLQNVSEKFHRVLDQPLEQGMPRFRAADVSGILNLVWECEGLQERPMDAAELLNPNKVKHADKLKTSKERRDWLKEKKKNYLDKYPVTHVDVKFHQSINTTMRRLKDKEDVFNNWEVGSQYKSLYRKDQIKAERRIYEAAQNQAKRFTEWYERQLPHQFAEYKRSLSRDPTLQPFKRSTESASPAYDEDSPEPKVKKEPGLTETDAQGDKKSVEGSRAIAPKPPQDQPQKTSSQPPETGDDELSEAEQEEAALEGWCAAKGITPNNISGKDRHRFAIYYDVWKKNK